MVRSNRRRIIIAGTRPKKSKKAFRGTKAQAPLVNLINRVIGRHLETKYVAEQINLGGYTISGSINPTADAHSMLPQLVQTAGASVSNTRIGDKVTPTRATISGHIWYDNLDTVVGNVIYVKLFFLTVKPLKHFPNILTDAPDGMFESGLADPVNWAAAGQELQSFYPICKENYTLLKSKTFKLAKNGGLPIGNQPGHDTNIGKDRYTFSYSWKPPALKYSKDADTYASNYAPVMYAVAYSPGYNYTTDASLVGQARMSWQVTMSYKDA